MNYKLGDICKHLGVTMTSEFVEQTLGVSKDGQDKRAVLFSGDSYALICDALSMRMQSMRDEMPTALPPVKAAPKAPKASGKTEVATSNFDDEEL